PQLLLGPLRRVKVDADPVRRFLQLTNEIKLIHDGLLYRCTPLIYALSVISRQKNKVVIGNAIYFFEQSNLERIGEALAALPIPNRINGYTDFFCCFCLCELRIHSCRSERDLQFDPPFLCAYHITLKA